MAVLRLSLAVPTRSHPFASPSPGPGPGPSRSDRRALAAATAALGLVLATHLFDFGAERLRWRLFNAGSADSWSHLVVAALLVAATVIAAARAVRDRRGWPVVALALAVLATSEVTPLHARIDRLSWGKLIYVPLLLTLAVALWRLAWARRARRWIGGGLALLAVAYVIHVLGPHALAALHWGGAGWPYQIKVGLKQGTELAGWLLVAGGITERQGPARGAA